MSQKYETKASIIHTNEVLIAPPQVAGAINQLTKNTGGTFPTGFYSGQTFLIGSSPFKVNSVDVYLVSTAARTGNHTVEIWATDSDTPDNSSIIAVSENVSGASIPVNGTANATTAQAVTFVFSSPPTLNPATKYAIVWKNTTDGSVFVARASGNLYTDGRYGFAQSPYNLAAWTPNMNATEDMTFAILGTEVSDRVFFGAPSGSILDFTELSEIDFTGVTLTGLSSSGANATLSNLTSPTSINQDLLPDTNSTKTLGSTSLRWSNVWGTFVRAGTSVLSDTYNAFNGLPILRSGNVTAPDGTSYQISLTSAAGTDKVAVYSTNITGANSTPTPNLGIFTGNKTHADSTGVTGDVLIKTGDSASTASGGSGNLILQTGTIVSGTRGKLKFIDGTEGTVGHVWTQTNADGSGEWQAAAGGGANTTLSNLTGPTAINQNLIPDAMANNRILGAAGNSTSNPKWAVLYLQNSGTAISINSDNITEALTIGNVSLPNLAFSGYGLRSPITQRLVFNTAARTLQNSGDFAVETGNYQGTTGGQRSGQVYLRTGNATQSGGSTGDITLHTGTVVSGTRGTINLIEDSLGAASVGYVWTLQNTSTGAGAWATAGGGGANTTLSNLTSPTAINQNLIFDTTNTEYFIQTADDAAISTRHLHIKTGALATGAGTNTGNLTLSTGIPVDSADWSGNATLETGAAGSGGSGNMFVRTGNCTSNGPSGNLTIQTGTTGGTRGQITVAARLINLSSAPLGSNWSPDGAGTRSLGDTTNRFLSVFANTVFAGSGVNIGGRLTNVITTPSGISAFGINSVEDGRHTAVHSWDSGVANANATGSIYIESGNKTAGTGDSGSINLITGTSVGGARGSIVMSALSLNLAGAPIGSHIIPNTNTRDLGSASFFWNILYANDVRGPRIRVTDAVDSNLNHIEITAIPQTAPDSVSYNTSIRTIRESDNLGIWTRDSAITSTTNVSIQTGNASSGNSGDILLQTGTASGSRGRIELLASAIDHNQVVSEAVVWQSGVTGSRPGSPVVGQRFFDTTLGIPIWYNGTNWVDATGATV